MFLVVMSDEIYIEVTMTPLITKKTWDHTNTRTRNKELEMFEPNLATPNILIMQLTHVKSKQHIDEAEILSSTRFEHHGFP